jgi:multidrug efflux system outer membrane protein
MKQRHLMKRINYVLSILLVTSALTACSNAPKYEVPTAPGPDKFKEASIYETYWQPASNKAGQVDQGKWWLIFNDPDLDALQEQATQYNPNLQAAAARVQQADAIVNEARSALFPAIDLSAGVTRGNIATGDLTTAYSILGAISYEIDFFGRVRDAVKVVKANKKQADELYRQALLFLHADVAQNYFMLQALDTERNLLRQTIRSREEYQQLVLRRFKEGEAAEQESLRAQAELASVRADLLAIDQNRAVVEHALSVLVGKAPSEFTQSEKELPHSLPLVPAGLPSSVLERRPDIAVAQAQLAANNAKIGIARAAFFPVIGLTAQGGTVSDDLGGIFKWSNRAWAVGPLLSLPIFDGGRRKAELAFANAEFQESVATYRQDVLVAFKEVEDNLSSLRLEAERAKQLYEAAEKAKKAENISQIRYREGESSFLEVLDTQRDTLAAQRAYTQTQGQRFATTINLIRALGGGWNVIEATPVTQPVQQPTPETVKKEVPVEVPPVPVERARVPETPPAMPMAKPEPVPLAQPKLHPQPLAPAVPQPTAPTSTPALSHVLFD